MHAFLAGILHHSQAFAMTTEEPSLKCQFMCVFPFKND